MREQGTKTSVYQKIKTRLPHFDIDRIENTIVSGVFDCTLTHVTGMIWAELKVQNHFSILDDMRPSQLAWAYLKCKKGLSHSLCVISAHERKETIDLWRLYLDESKKDPQAKNGILAEHWSSHKWSTRLQNDTISLEHSLLQLMHLRSLQEKS